MDGVVRMVDKYALQRQFAEAPYQKRFNISLNNSKQILNTMLTISVEPCHETGDFQI